MFDHANVSLRAIVTLVVLYIVGGIALAFAGEWFMVVIAGGAATYFGVWAFRKWRGMVR